MSNKEHVIIFGGTGHAGQYVLQRAVDEGLKVTAFVRTPSKIPEKLRKNIAIVQGNVLDEKSVGNAIQNHDAVLSALGKGFNLSPTTLMSDGTRNIVKGMKMHGVKKLVVICGGGSLPNYWMPWFIQNLVKDHRRVLDILKQEREYIDWVSLHPPLIKGSAHVNTGYTLEKDDLNGQMFVTAGEIADFMMRYISNAKTSKEYKHCLVGISSGPAFISSSTLIFICVSLVLLTVAMSFHYFITL